MRTTLLTLFMSLLALAPAGLAAANVCGLEELANITPGGSLTQTDIDANTAYVAAGNRGIARIAVTDPHNPLLDGFDATQGQEAYDLAMSSFNNLVVADGDAGVGFYSTEGGVVHLGTLDLGEKIITIGSLATQLFAGSDQGTLFAVSPTDILLEGSLAMTGTLRAMALKPPWVYAALGDGGLAVVDASDRANPVLVDTLDLGGAVMSVTRDGNVLYCGVDGVGLVSLSADGGTVVSFGSLSLPGTPYSIVASGGRIYMAAPDTGVMVADASLGDNMLLLGELSMNGAVGLAKAGDILYVGLGSNGWSTVDASGCAGGGQITAYYIPASARAVGAENTYWVTDVAVTNFTNSSAVVNIAYLKKDRNNSSPVNISFAIESGEQQLLTDVFDSLFGLESGNGGLRITVSDQDVKATSRTYNAAGAAGTYGQFIPAIEMNEALAPGVTGVLLQLQEDSDFRTNLGMLSRAAVQTEVQIDFYRANGSKAGTRIVNLKPYEMKQFNIRQYSGQMASGYALININTDDARIFVYASVVDNGSGDPIYIPAQKLSTAPIFGQ
jgi:hypothetical protein